jgi:LacI family transcriptional regulator, galactose operon repressor
MPEATTGVFLKKGDTQGLSLMGLERGLDRRLSGSSRASSEAAKRGIIDEIASTVPGGFSAAQRGNSTDAHVDNRRPSDPRIESRSGRNLLFAKQNQRCVAANHLPTAAIKDAAAPRSIARTLNRDARVRIGLLCGKVSAAFFRELLAGCGDQASLSHAQLVVARCDNSGQQEPEAVKELLNMDVDGFILLPPLCESKRLHAAVIKSGALAVTVASARPRPGLLSVSINDHVAAFAMTRHIVSLGHRRIGFITGNPGQSASPLRLAGYRRALAEADIPSDDSLVREGLFTYESGVQAAESLLALPNPPTAIFASNDDMAAATVAVAHRRHLDIPRELTVCGFDDTDCSRSIWPRLTTVRQPIADMSRAALLLLIRNIKAKRNAERDPSESVVLDFRLVHRDSDGPPAAH